MTIEEWNQLRPGDYIQRIGCLSVRFKIHALTPDEDWSDNDQAVLTHQLWLNPLLSPEDPLFPDIGLYDPGECDRFERASAKIVPMT
jgi:hypothetical protein